MFSVIIPLFKFADALVLPQWDAERVSKLGDSPKPFKFVFFDMKDGKQDLGVSKNRGIPKWMVYNGKPY